MTDRPRLQQFLDTAPDYRMPTFEDGSSYGPGSPVYETVKQRYSKPIWNALSDDAKWSAIDSISTQTEPTIEPVTTPTVNPERKGRIDAMLANLDRAKARRQVKQTNLPFHPRDIKGLFGGR